MDASNENVPAAREGQQRRRLLAAAVLAIVIVAFCAAVLAAWPAIQIATERTAQVRLGASELVVALADTEARRSWGLQGRRALSPGTGMVFVFPDPMPVTFATKSVAFPLDVVFIGPDRRVTGVARLDHSETLASSQGDVGWVVEVPAGWAEGHAVGVGSPFVPPR